MRFAHHLQILFPQIFGSLICSNRNLQEATRSCFLHAYMLLMLVLSWSTQISLLFLYLEDAVGAHQRRAALPFKFNFVFGLICRLLLLPPIDWEDRFLVEFSWAAIKSHAIYCNGPDYVLLQFFLPC